MMKALRGITSDRIRKGTIPADAVFPARVKEEPSDAAVRNAQGQGLGKGPTAARNGGAS